MPLSHLLLAVAIVFVWGTNFVVMKWGLGEFPPLLLAALRFTMSFAPWALLIRRPQVPLWRLAAFGVLLGSGQFGLLFYALKGDVSPGLASLGMQSQVFLTIGLAMALQGERPRPLQWMAMALAVGGFGVMGWHSSQAPGAAVTGLGLVLIVLAASCWAAANLVARGAGKVDALAFMVWSSPFSLPLLLSASFLLEGGAAIGQALLHASWMGWAVVLWQALGNTLFGFGAWNWLLARHPAATVAPMALLVPVFGMSSSALLLGEPMPGWKLLAAGLVMGGLALNLYASRLRMPVPATGKPA